MAPRYITQILFQVLCSVHVHEHETNYAGTLTSKGGYFCVLMVSQIVQISWKT